jgi:hypothetical protein
MASTSKGMGFASISDLAREARQRRNRAISAMDQIEVDNAVERHIKRANDGNFVFLEATDDITAAIVSDVFEVVKKESRFTVILDRRDGQIVSIRFHDHDVVSYELKRIREAKEALEKQGHTTVPVKFAPHWAVTRLLSLSLDSFLSDDDRNVEIRRPIAA